MDFWRHLKQLFSAPEPQSAESCSNRVSGLEQQGLIQRSEDEKARFRDWLASPWPQRMFDWIEAEYQEHLRGQQRDKAIGFLDLPSINGFVISYDPKRWDADDFFCFFDYFKYRLAQIGYRCHLSDFKTQQNQACAHMTQRHYLKPPRPSFDPEAPPAEQLYGNIMVCLCQENEKIVQLKFSATHYQDRKYLPARAFKHLIKELHLPKT